MDELKLSTLQTETELWSKNREVGGKGGKGGSFPPTPVSLFLVPLFKVMYNKAFMSFFNQIFKKGGGGEASPPLFFPPKKHAAWGHPVPPARRV